MAHTHLELTMDQFVREHLKVGLVVHTKDSKTGEWRLLSENENLNDDTSYKMGVSARNDGTETSVRNVQIRVNLPSATKRIIYYANERYGEEIEGRESEIYPQILHPGEKTPDVEIHFMVTEGPDEEAPVANVELHAEVIPQGHATYEPTRILD